MASKTDLLKRERDDLRRLADHWKLQHDEHKELNAKLAARVEELEAALRDIIADSYSVYAIQVARAALNNTTGGINEDCL